MDRFDTVIIGSGLGGLECAYLLAKHGMKVCVLEKNREAGGCLQSFRRGDREFDTGFHCVGSLGEGEILQRIFRYFGLMELPWHRLDPDSFEEVFTGGKSYLLANGYENFAERLGSFFPHERDAVRRYSEFLREVGDHTADLLFAGQTYAGAAAAGKLQRLFARDAYGFLEKGLGNRSLIDVVSGNALKMELDKATLPLYVFAQISSSFIKSAWRLFGNSSAITRRLVEGIRKNGGEVITGAEVTLLAEEEGAIRYAEIRRRDPEGRFQSKESERVYAEKFISDLSPALTVSLIGECAAIRPIFRKRVLRLEQTFGMFTVNISLRKNTVEYFNRNIYSYVPELESPWDICDAIRNGKTAGVMITSRVPESAYMGMPGRHFTENIDILAPMDFGTVRKWADTSAGKRGEEYTEFKNSKAEEVISLAEKHIPGLRGAVEGITTSTPLTWMDYTGAVCGTAYGIRKKCNDLSRTLIPTGSPIPNLFFTGQNLNLHGILGVSITSLMTCSRILGNGSVASVLKQ